VDSETQTYCTAAVGDTFFFSMISHASLLNYQLISWMPFCHFAARVYVLY